MSTCQAQRERDTRLIYSYNDLYQWFPAASVLLCELVDHQVFKERQNAAYHLPHLQLGAQTRSCFWQH